MGSSGIVIAAQSLTVAGGVRGWQLNGKFCVSTDPTYLESRRFIVVRCQSRGFSGLTSLGIGLGVVRILFAKDRFGESVRGPNTLNPETYSKPQTLKALNLLP